MDNGSVTINVYNNRRGYYGSGCCFPMMSYGMMPPMGSCFGFGFMNPMLMGPRFGCNSRALECGIGVGLGMVAGTALIAAAPAIGRGISKLWHKIFG